MISESRVRENCMPGLMSGDWKRSTVSGPQRLQLDAWTAPDLSATAPAPDSTQNLSLKEGRFFTQQEDTSGAQVVDLSTNAANGLFPGNDPVGQTVRIGSVDF